MRPERLLAEDYDGFVEEIELVRGASHEFSLGAFSGRPADTGLFRDGAGKLWGQGDAQ